MEATVKRFASLLAVLLTFLMINPSSANAAAPSRELLHNGLVDTAHVEWGTGSDRPIIKGLWGSDDLRDPNNVYAQVGSDADPGSDKPMVLDHGHTDIFRVGSTDNGGLDLKLKEDVTGEGILHAPENVLLKIKDAALMDIPAGLPGVPRGYVLPLTQNPEVLWPGWETFDVKRNDFSAVKINISNVKGPGKVNLFSQGSFGDLQALLDGGSNTQLACTWDG